MQLDYDGKNASKRLKTCEFERILAFYPPDALWIKGADPGEHASSPGRFKKRARHAKK
jgi:hypothetical protein